jgi:hypothetical protein
MNECGETAVKASGKPLRPSTTANMISSMPRLRSSFMTRSQKLGHRSAAMLFRHYSKWIDYGDFGREAAKLNQIYGDAGPSKAAI